MEEHKRETLADGYLVAQAQQGDKGAFEQLYRRNVNRVYAVCLRIVADIPRAEELTQRSFIRAWEMLRTFRQDSAFSSWLHRIAVNVVLVDLRTEQRRRSRVQSSDAIDDVENADDPMPIESAIDLERAITLLPSRARTILVLHDLEGFQHEEIAIMLEITVGTSKSQLHRAHKLLKERLEQ